MPAFPDLSVATISNTVQTSISQADSYTEKVISETDAFLSELITSMQINPPYMNWTPNPFNPPTIEVTAIAPTRPNLDGEISTALGGLTKPEGPTYDTVDHLDDVTVNDFTDKLPTLDLPTIPDPDFPTVPPSPGIADVPVPVRPQFELPVVPTIQSVAIPPMPSDQIPLLNLTVPDNTLTVPGVSLNFSEQEYLSDLLDSIKAKVTSDITSGGQGLGAEIETNMWERMKERDAKANRDAIDNLVSEYSGKAMDLPTGALTGATRKILSDYEDKKQDESRGITIEQAKLALDNYKIALQAGVQVEGVLIAHHDAVATRALEFAKAVVDSALAVFNAQAANYNLNLRKVEVARGVYDSQVAASLQRIQYYRLQIESIKIESDIQMQYVELYKAEIQGLDALLGIYKTDMEAANLALGTQKLKIDMFESQVNAYGAQIKAETDKFEAFKAKIAGETAKATAFEAQARGYTAYVQGKDAQSKVKIAKQQAQISKNDQLLKQFLGDVELYKAVYTAAMERVKASAEMFTADADIYRSDIQKAAEQARLNVEQASIQERNVEAQAQLIFEYAKQNLSAFLSVAALKKETAASAAQISVTKLAAFFNAFTAVVHASVEGIANSSG